MGRWLLGERVALVDKVDDRRAPWARLVMTDDARHLATYVVRVSRDGSSQIRGVVVHVATGERFTFDSLDRMALLIRERVEADAAALT